MTQTDHRLIKAPPATPPRVTTTQTAAPKRRSRNGLILAVLAVLIGGAIAATVAKAMTSHNPVLIVARTVNVGQTLTDADLSTASISKDPSIATIPASDRNQIIGQTALVELVPGVPLARAQVGTGTGLDAGQAIVPLPLKPAQLPARPLLTGQKIMVIATPGQAAASGATTQLPTTGTTAVISEVGRQDTATQVTVVDVRVRTDNAAALAQQASTGNIAILILPTN